MLKPNFNSPALPLYAKPSRFSGHKYKRRPSNGIFPTTRDPSTPHKKTFLLLLFFLSLIQWLVTNIINYSSRKTNLTIDYTFQGISLGLLIGAFCILFFSQSRLSIRYIHRLICPILACICLSASLFLHHFFYFYKALGQNSLPAYHSLFFNFPTLITNTLISDRLFQHWSLKALLPVTNIWAIIIAFQVANTGTIGLYWINIAICFIFIFLLFILKSLPTFSKTSKQKDWTQFYQKILDSIPNSITLIDKSNQALYQNLAFQQLSARYDQNILEKIEVTRSRLHDLDKSPFSVNHRFDHAESHGNLTKMFEEEDFDKSLQKRPTRTTTLPCLNNLAGVIKLIRATNTENQENSNESPESHFFCYEGKLSNPKGSVPPTRIEVKLCKLPESSQILLILSESASPEIVSFLESANEYKDKLLATVSHEMRTPLNGNMALIEAAIGEKDIPEYIKEKLLIPAHQSGQFLNYLVNDFLDIAQIQAKKLKLAFSKLPLRTTLENCYKLLELKSQKQNVPLVLHLDESLPTYFNTDHHRLSQILLNLLNNALKFTLEGEVRLTVRMVKPSLLEFCIQDSGIGMSKEDLNQLFSQFTKISYGKMNNINPTGVGLGLYIANSLAKVLGPKGSKGISVESELTKGSMFSFLVQEARNEEEEEDDHNNQETDRPLNNQGNDSFKVRKKSNFHTTTGFNPTTTLTNDDRSYLESLEEHTNACQPHPSPIPKRLKRLIKTSVVFGLQETQLRGFIKKSYRNLMKASSRGEDPTVLIVDDEPFNILALETMINKLGIRTEFATNGKEAIEKVKRRSKMREEYNMIFMDCQMPIMNGYQTAEELKKMAREGEVGEVPIVGCSAFVSREHSEKWQESGMDEMITKPLGKEKVEEVLVKYLKNLLKKK